MGRGSSKIGSGGAGKYTPHNKDGIDYDAFMKMSQAEKYDFLYRVNSEEGFLDDSNYPDYLDNSYTSKILYALGKTDKPTVVDDATLDTMQGREIFRTVYESGQMPPPQADDIRNGDYTQMSGKGGSAYGRAIYFATNFSASADYGAGMDNALIMRGKINTNANIRSTDSLAKQMTNDSNWQSSNASWYLGSDDSIAAYAIANGIDGWYSGSYTMMVNRGAITMSSANKSISGSKTNRKKVGYSQIASGWNSAVDYDRK